MIPLAVTLAALLVTGCIAVHAGHLKRTIRRNEEELERLAADLDQMEADVQRWIDELA